VTAVVALPFHFHPRPVGSLHFALAELVIVTTAAVWLARALWTWLRSAPLPGQPTADRDRQSMPTDHANTQHATRSTQHATRIPLLWSHLRASPFFWPAVLFLAAGTLALVAARGEHLREAVRAYRLTIVEPMVFAVLLVLTLRPALARLAAVVAVAVAALVGAHALGQYLLGQGVAPMEGVERAASVYPSATALALYLGRAAPLAAGLALFECAGADARRRAGAWLLLAPIVGGLAATWTRGAWIGVWVAVLVMLLVGGRRRLALGWLGLAALGVAALALARVERLATLVSLSDGTNVSRLLIWESALAALRDHWLLGIGLDQFLYLDRARYGVPDVRFLLLSHPHNAVLDLWLSLGLLGLVAGIWLVVVLVRVLTSPPTPSPLKGGGVAARGHPSPPPFRGEGAGGRGLALGLLGSAVAGVVHGMVDLSYFSPDLALWWWFLIGLAEVRRAGGRGGTADARPGAPTPAPEPAGGAGTGGAAPARSAP